MQKINNETGLWVEKYRPQTIDDIIATKPVKKMLMDIKETKEVPNLLLSGTAGVGKTTIAKCICNDVNSEYLFINASSETSVDTVRYKVQQFATTSSLLDNKKVIILDEFDRMSNNAQDAMKALIEQTEANCRFIFSTNNIQKIIDPLKSRVSLIEFKFTEKESVELMIQYFKRIIFILENEKVEYDKESVSEFVKKLFPDFRKTINELQTYYKKNGKIDSLVSIYSDKTDVLTTLIEEIKMKNFNKMCEIAPYVEATEFYTFFYNNCYPQLENKCKPKVILKLNEYNVSQTEAIDPLINLVACCTELMESCIWQR